MKKHALKISLIVSTVSLLLTLIINYTIAKEYLRSSGKTRALFGIKEALQFGYQYYVVLAGACALIFALISKPGNNQIKTGAILYSLIAMGIVFTRAWRMFI